MNDYNYKTKQNLINEKGINYYEHQNYFKFIFSCIVSGFLGSFIGAIVEEITAATQRHAGNKNRLKSGAFVLYQLFLISTTLYIGNLAPFIKSYLYFDDWLMSTFAGFIFALTFINVQNSLTTNIQSFIFNKSS